MVTRENILSFSIVNRKSGYRKGSVHTCIFVYVHLNRIEYRSVLPIIEVKKGTITISTLSNRFSVIVPIRNQNGNPFGDFFEWN